MHDLRAVTRLTGPVADRSDSVQRRDARRSCTQFETHELIEAGDLTAIAERAKGITYQPPGA